MYQQHSNFGQFGGTWGLGQWACIGVIWHGSMSQIYYSRQTSRCGSIRMGCCGLSSNYLYQYIKNTNIFKSHLQHNPNSLCLPHNFSTNNAHICWSHAIIKTYLYCQQSVKMNMRTFHKLSEQILNHDEEDKENYITNTTNKSNQVQLGRTNKLVSHEQIVNIKRMNAKKIQQLTHLNQRKIQEIKQSYELQKNGLIQKYEKILQEKQDYIKMLEELYSNQSNQQPRREISPKMEEQPKEKHYSLTNSYRSIQPFNQTLYLHQAPLYNQICYSIQRPTEIGNKNVSDFFSTQKIKSRLISNEKPKQESSVSSSKFRSQSTNRNSASRHVLMPACPPKYGKIL